jgi:hypothetical protein
MAPRSPNRLELDTAGSTVGRTGATRETGRPGCGWRRSFRWRLLLRAPGGRQAGVGRTLTGISRAANRLPSFFRTLGAQPFMFHYQAPLRGHVRAPRRNQAGFPSALLRHRAGILRARPTHTAALVPAATRSAVTRHPSFQPLKAVSGNFWLCAVTGR